MSFVLLGILNSQASGAAQAYFLSVLGGADQENATGITTDSSNNIYATGETVSTGAGEQDALLVKYNSTGGVEWQRTLGGSTTDRGRGVVLGSFDDVYMVAETFSTGAGQNDFLTAKYNSAGTIQWQRVLGGTGFDQARSIAIDSSDNVYIFGESDSRSGGISESFLAKYDSSGTIQWQRTLGGSNTTNLGGVTVDSLNNVYFVSRTAASGAGAFDFLIAKYNSAGTIQWQRTLGGSNTDAVDFPSSIVTDSSDNLYFVGFTDSIDPAVAQLLIAKYNSAGTIQWQRVLGASGGNRGRGIAIDSADNVYTLGFTNATGAGSNDFLIAKYDSAGTIQWQRVLGGTGNDTGSSISIDSNDDITILGTTASTGAGLNDFLIAKLPNDGSLEGTYLLDGNNIVYQASSLTTATSPLTDASASLTSSVASLTSATSTLTSAAASLTVVTEEIG